MTRHSDDLLRTVVTILTPDTHPALRHRTEHLAAQRQRLHEALAQPKVTHRDVRVVDIGTRRTVGRDR